MSHVLALCGGVGGAKMAFGLADALDVNDLTLVVNTGDDFEHLGLHVSPDIDTVTYTLAGLADRERGWGLADETWRCMASLGRLGAATWFQLGDQDLATHIERTRRLSCGESLSEVTSALAKALGVRHHVAPMSDQPVRTTVLTKEGELPFQRYFVAERCLPVAHGVRFEGAALASTSPGLKSALQRDDLAAVIICPSNPYLSVDPILAIPGVRAALAGLDAPVVAVSPIVGGKALKGPAAKIMAELGATVSPVGVANHYDGLLAAMVVDTVDGDQAAGLEAIGVRPLVTSTVMVSDYDRRRLADEVLSFARSFARVGAKTASAS